MIVSACRKAHFNAAHRLNNPAWSVEKNELIFGSCNNPNFHGHNYELIVKLTGEPDPETGYLFDLKILKEIIKLEIEDRFDHKNLNLDTMEFKTLNPTAENISIVIWNILRTKLSQKLKLHITLYETPNNYVEYDGTSE
ncbi:MAG: 6-carboxytetrahydropterin synthase [Bacteroidetes bacterium]|nr:6-carboxytetrahydropterin synthase [Bacteroidota bacterium]